jgi:hypothetical protein
MLLSVPAAVGQFLKVGNFFRGARLQRASLAVIISGRERYNSAVSKCHVGSFKSSLRRS